MEERYSVRVTRQLRENKPLPARLYYKVTDFFEDAYWAFFQEKPRREIKTGHLEQRTGQASKID